MPSCGASPLVSYSEPVRAHTHTHQHTSSSHHARVAGLRTQNKKLLPLRALSSWWPSSAPKRKKEHASVTGSSSMLSPASTLSRRVSVYHKALVRLPPHSLRVCQFGDLFLFSCRPFLLYLAFVFAVGFVAAFAPNNPFSPSALLLPLTLPSPSPWPLSIQIHHAHCDSPCQARRFAGSKKCPLRSKQLPSQLTVRLESRVEGVANGVKTVRVGTRI